MKRTLVLLFVFVPVLAFGQAVNVSKAVKILATATDTGCGVAYVQLRLDGANLGPQLTASPYEFTWDSKTVPNGPHILSATAADKAGPNCDGTEPNIGVSNNITINVQNNTDTTPPTIELLINGVKVAEGLGPTLEYLQARVTPPRENTIQVRIK